MGRDERVDADSSNETLAALRDVDWERTGIYNWPTRQPRTIDWIARHTIHEGQTICTSSTVW